MPIDEVKKAARRAYRRRPDVKAKDNAASRAYYAAHKEELAELSKVYRRKRPYLKARAHAKESGREFTLTEEEYNSIWNQDCCSYCREGFDQTVRLRQKSIDRLDSTKGYVLGNVVLLCMRCNTRKSNWDVAGLRALADWLEAKLRGVP